MLLKQRMKYRLVKEYPGSPELGTIIYEAHNSLWLYERPSNEFLKHSIEVIKKHPEFWQPTDELTSELTNSPKGSLQWLNTNMGFVLRVGEYLHTKETLQQSELLWNWGEKIEKIAKETMEYFKDKLE